MVIYEVQLTVEALIRDEFREWLEDHVLQMLGIEGFESAEILRDEARPDVFVVHYRLGTREALQRYFNEHSSRMRQDGIQRFGSKFKAERRILLRET